MPGLSATTSWFVTLPRVARPRHLARLTDAKNFREPSWFRRLVPVRPGSFVLPAPDTSKVYDPLPPSDALKGEPVGPRYYFGRITDVLEGTLALTLWEVPNGRELLANVAPDRAKGVTTRGSLARGTPVYVWTWTEHNRQGAHERLHIAPMDRTTAKPRVRRKK